MEIKLRRELIAEKTISISELKPHPKSIEIYGKDESIDDLVRNMNEDGFDNRCPIFVNQNYQIISGHRRVRAATKIGLKEVSVQIYKYSDELEELLDLLNTNTNRKKLPLSEIREGQLRKYIHTERAKLHLGDHKSVDYRESKNIQEKITCPEFGQVISNDIIPIDSLELAANDIQMSRSNFNNGEQVVDTIDILESKGETKAAQVLTNLGNKYKSHNIAYEVKKQVEKSGIDIATVLKQSNIEKVILNEKATPKDIKKEIDIVTTELKKEQLSKDIKVYFDNNKLPPEKLKEIQEAINRGLFKTQEQVIQSLEIEKNKIPEKFDVIVIDPPWPYGTEYDEESRRVGSPYPEMSLEEISNIKIPAKDDSILWLWTTHKFMRESFKLLDKWGFTDKMILTWVKNRMGMGTWLRSKSEFCIMAVKGKPNITLTNQTTVLTADVREHSRKPDEFYNMVDSLCVGEKLDYFSREKRDGWYQVGNEPNKF